jgi:hypothetical protein
VNLTKLGVTELSDFLADQIYVDQIFAEKDKKKRARTQKRSKW